MAANHDSDLNVFLDPWARKDLTFVDEEEPVSDPWERKDLTFVDRPFLSAVGDTSLDLAKGVVGMGESVVGFADLLTGNYAGKGLAHLGYDPKRTHGLLSRWQSPERQQDDEAIHKAEGFSDTAAELVKRPSRILGLIAESAPMMLGTIGAVRLYASKLLAAEGLAAGTAEAAAFLKDNIGKITTVGNAVEGLLAAGQIQEGARQEGRTWDDSAIWSVLGGTATGLIGKASSKVPGFEDVEVRSAVHALGAHERRSLLHEGREIGKATFKEGVLEELPQSWQEQMAANKALGRADFTEGAGSAAAQGLFAGMGMGAGMRSTSSLRHAFRAPALQEEASFPQEPTPEETTVPSPAPTQSSRAMVPPPIIYDVGRTGTLKFNDGEEIKARVDAVSDGETLFLGEDEHQYRLDADSRKLFEFVPDEAPEESPVQPTEADMASPLDTDLIVAGKNIVEAVLNPDLVPPSNTVEQPEAIEPPSEPTQPLFTPTHTTSDGEPVMPSVDSLGEEVSDEWVAEDGSLIEDAYAVPRQQEVVPSVPVVPVESSAPMPLEPVTQERDLFQREQESPTTEPLRQAEAVRPAEVSDGPADFGAISQEVAQAVGKQPAPIRLRVGNEKLLREQDRRPIPTDGTIRPLERWGQSRARAHDKPGDETVHQKWEPAEGTEDDVATQQAPKKKRYLPVSQRSTVPQAAPLAPQKSEEANPGNYGKSNKVFTEALANKARERLRKKLSGDTLNAGIDPELMYDGLAENLALGEGARQASSPKPEIFDARESTSRFHRQPTLLTAPQKPASGGFFHGRSSFDEGREKSSGLSVAEVEKAIQRVREKWYDNAPYIDVIESFDDLPERAKALAERRGWGHKDIKGFAFEDRIYLVAKNLYSEETAVMLLLHEAVGHYGFRKFLGPIWEGFLDEMIETPLFERSLSRIARTYGLDMDVFEDRQEAAEELIANIAEHDPKSTLVHRLIIAVRDFLRDTFGWDLGLRWSDIIHLIHRSRDSLKKDSKYNPENSTKKQKGRFSTRRSSGLIPNLARHQKITDTLARIFQDRYQDLYNAQKLKGVTEETDGYGMEERMSGRQGERIADFDEKLVEPLVKAIHESGLELEEVEKYLHALHAPEANAYLKKINEKEKSSEENSSEYPGEEDIAANLSHDLIEQNGRNLDALSGMTHEESARIIQQYSGKKAALDGIAKQVRAISQSTVDLWVDGGLMTPKTATIIRSAYKHYVPLHREGFRDRPSREQGINVGGREYRVRTGSNRRVVNILGNLIAQHEAAIIRSEKAKVGRAVLAFAKANKAPYFWKVNIPPKLKTVKDGKVVEYIDPSYRTKEHVLRIKVDGKEQFIEFNEHDETAMRMAKSLKNLGNAEMGVVLHHLSKLNRFLSMVNTSLNPEFILSNLVRDIQTATIGLNGTDAKNLKRKILSDVRHAIAGIWKHKKGDRDGAWQRWYDEFRLAGGKVGWTQHYDTIEDRADGLRKKLKRLDPLSVSNAPGKLFSHAFDYISNMNEAVENGVRLSAYANARRAGVSEAKAASLAKNLTVNFNRRGEMGATMNALYLFFNAGVQGSARMMQTLTGKKGRQVALGIVVAAIAVEVMNAFLGGVDEEDDIPFIDKIPASERERNMVFQLGEHTVKIPLPWGYNVFWLAGAKIGKALTPGSASTLRDAADVFFAAVTAFNPMGSSGSFAQFASPTVFDPFVQVWENKAWHGGPLHPAANPYDESTKPNHKKHFRSTTEAAKGLSKVLHDATDWNEPAPPFLDIYPDTLDMLWDTVTGGAGKFLSRVWDFGAKSLESDFEEIPWRKLPVLRRVYGANIEGYTAVEYHKNTETVGYLEQRIKDAKEDGDQEEESRLKSKYRHLLMVILKLRSTRNALRRLSKRERFTEDEARKKDLQEKRETLMKKFNRAYYHALKGAK